MTSRPPPLYRQRRFWALAIPCAFTLGMLIFAIEHLIRDPNEVRQRSSSHSPDLISFVQYVRQTCKSRLNQKKLHDNLLHSNVKSTSTNGNLPLLPSK